MKKLMDYITMNLALLLLWSLYVTSIGELEPVVGAVCGFAAFIGLVHRAAIAKILFGWDEDEWFP